MSTNNVQPYRCLASSRIKFDAINYIQTVSLVVIIIYKLDNFVEQIIAIPTSFLETKKSHIIIFISLSHSAIRM